MKACSICKVRQPDELIEETSGVCNDANRCLENRKRTLVELAELCQGLINMSQVLTGWTKRCAAYAVENGFRTYDCPVNRENVSVFCTNLHGEVSELWEAFRIGKLAALCDKAGKMSELGLPPLTCAEEELADIFIRLMDTADALNVDMPKAVAAKHVYNTTRSFQHGGKLA